MRSNRETQTKNKTENQWNFKIEKKNHVYY